MSNKAISTLEMSHSSWIDHRYESICASDAGAVLGINPYKSPVDVYMEKVTRTNDFEDNFNMWLGREMEPLIKKKFTLETGLKVRDDNKIRMDKEYPFLSTNLDGMVVGEKVPVEYKALGFFDGEIPDYYFAQLQHQMMVTEAEYAYFAVVCLGRSRSFNVQKVDFNEEFVKLMREELVTFWNENVLQEVMPEPTNLDDIKRMYPISDPGSILELEDSSLSQKLAVLKDSRATIKEHTDIAKAVQVELMDYMGDKEILTKDGENLISWKQTKETRKFDAKKFAEDHPDLYEEYKETKPGSRRFLIK